jgi:hypothetical protein
VILDCGPTYPVSASTVLIATSPDASAVVSYFPIQFAPSPLPFPSHAALA